MALSPLMPMSPPSGGLSITDADTVAAGTGGAAFGQLLQQLLASNAQSSEKANNMVQSLINGKAENLHTVSLAVAQADISFRFLLELRNRATEAYQEIMRMQI
jgi:flagellar hook-basal body complex protein FliE